MKKIIYIIVAAAVSGIVAGCSKETADAGQGQQSGFELKVLVPQTKTVFDGQTYEVDWETGDELGVVIYNGTESSLYKFTKSSEEENSFISSEFKPEEGQEYTYYVLYPYDETFSVTEEKSNPVVKISSGTQAAADDAGHIKTPLYGMGTSSGTTPPVINLAHAASVMKINVANYSGSAMSITKVGLASVDENAVMAGTFSIDFTSGVLSPAENAVSCTAAVSLDAVSLPNESSADFYVAVAPFATEADLSILVNDEEFEKNGISYDFKAGQVYTSVVTCGSPEVAVEAGGETVGALNQTLEDENIYAWRAQLNEGSFHISTSGGYISASNKAFSASSSYTIAETSEEASWTITESGIYRIVINAENNTVAVYSPDNDLAPKYANGSWADGSLAGYGKKPEENTVEVECLWMYGPFSSFSDNSGVKQGFNYKYRCIRSLADPYIFVYSGDELPRIEGNANAGSAKKWTEGALVFFIGPEKPHDGSNEFSSSNTAQTEPRPYNNSYAFGYSDTESVRNQVCDSFKASVDTEYGLREGQDDSRYAYFEIPEGCNYVLVDTREMTVVFRHVE